LRDRSYIKNYGLQYLPLDETPFYELEVWQHFDNCLIKKQEFDIESKKNMGTKW